MKVEFITEPDCMGKGRVIVDGRYYGLPLEAVILFRELLQVRGGEYICGKCGLRQSLNIKPEADF